MIETENFPDSRWKTRVCKPAFSLHRGTKLVFFVSQNRNALVLFRNSSEFLRGISGKEKFGWVIEHVFYKSRVSISVWAHRKIKIFTCSIFQQKDFLRWTVFWHVCQNFVLLVTTNELRYQKWMKKCHNCLSDFERILKWFLCKKTSSGCAKQPST